ncbi:MAG: sulfur carrier protein ThiS [Methylocapsa sp.]|nr:sulfur carrier protein ThiS [Methylocapsa sp.]
MQIQVNGELREVFSATLDALLCELEYNDAAVATALNQTFVRRRDRSATKLKEGDAVEVLVPRQGG